MPLLGQKTTATHLEWHVITTLLLKLQKDKNYRLALLIGIQAFTGLRVGDVLKLKYSDFLNKSDLTIVEQKTKKHRIIRLNNSLKELVSNAYKSQMIKNPDEQIFLNRYGTKLISVQYVNRALKKTMLRYKLTNDPTQIKSHLLRKSFGRHVYEMNNKNDMGLIILSELFQHSSPSVTRLYLGIKQQELADVYENL
jgi:integrase